MSHKGILPWSVNGIHRIFSRGGGGGVYITCMPWSMLRQAWKSWWVEGGGGWGLWHFFFFFKPQHFGVNFQTQGRGTHRISPTSLTSKKSFSDPKGGGGGSFEPPYPPSPLRTCLTSVLVHTLLLFKNLNSTAFSVTRTWRLRHNPKTCEPTSWVWRDWSSKHATRTLEVTSHFYGIFSWDIGCVSKHE